MLPEYVLPFNAVCCEIHWMQLKFSQGDYLFLHTAERAKQKEGKPSMPCPPYNATVQTTALQHTIFTSGLKASKMQYKI